jgi:hypothetical protein
VKAVGPDHCHQFGDERQVAACRYLSQKVHLLHTQSEEHLLKNRLPLFGHPKTLEKRFEESMRRENARGKQPRDVTQRKPVLQETLPLHD